MNKKYIINTLVVLLTGTVIFGFIYTSSNKAVVSIEPVKTVISSYEITKTHTLNSKKA